MLTLPENAPFNGAQRMWIKGFLDGISSTLVQGAAAPSKSLDLPAGIPVTIAYGSQTGNAESLGKKLAKNLSTKGHLPVVRDMAELSAQDLANIGHLLIITSTYGDGEPPDNAATFHASLHADDIPSLSSLNYSVLALGDSNYPAFCKCGHDFDQRLAMLGAKRLAPIVECDVEYDEPFASWISQLEQVLTAA